MSISLRLQKLRAWMVSEQVEGVIVPHTNEFQNEYLPLCHERLAHITGFKGSAGLAIILKDKAFLFVDGRYILAAQKEVAGDLFTVNLWTPENMRKLFQDIMPKGTRLGVDPWTITYKDQDMFCQFMTLGDHTLVKLNTNPIDAINEALSLPDGSIFLYDERYSGQSFQDKCAQISLGLRDKKIDMAYLPWPESVNWLLNIRGRDVACTPLALCTAMIHSDAKVDLFIVPSKVDDSFRVAWKDQVRIHDIKDLRFYLESLESTQTLLVDPDRTPVAVLDILEKRGNKVKKGSDPCQLPKAQKNSVEQEGMRLAHLKDGIALVQFFSSLEGLAKGLPVKEAALAKILDAKRAAQDGFFDLSFDTISAAGPNGAIVHYHAREGTDRILEKGDIYLVDSGGQYWSGTTDVTRTILWGAMSATDHQKEMYTRVLKGQIALAQQQFPKGTTGSALDVLARQYLWQQGVDFDHGTGHGVGTFLSVHEGPQNISKRLNSQPLLPGMVVSNEPGYYEAGAFGIRLENLILVKEGAPGFLIFETLTLAPYEPKLIDASLLIPSEIQWLKVYHQQVLNLLSPHISTTEKTWLKGITDSF